VSGRKAAPIVSREYQSDPDACANALKLLLKKPINKAARPAPEPDGCDGTKVQGDSTDAKIIPEPC